MRPCCTQMPKARWFFFFSASASLSSCAKVFGTLTSFVLTSRPMFSTCTGMPYSFFTAVPYENASSVYFGNSALTALLG